MIRNLVIIAVAGLIMSVVCISAALAIGGPAVLAHGGWWRGPHVWSWESRDGRSWSRGWSFGGDDRAGPPPPSRSDERT